MCKHFPTNLIQLCTAFIVLPVWTGKFYRGDIFLLCVIEFELCIHHFFVVGFTYHFITCEYVCTFCHGVADILLGLRMWSLILSSQYFPEVSHERLHYFLRMICWWLLGLRFWYSPVTTNSSVQDYRPVLERQWWVAVILLLLAFIDIFLEVVCFCFFFFSVSNFSRISIF